MTLEFVIEEPFRRHGIENHTSRKPKRNKQLARKWGCPCRMPFRAAFPPPSGFWNEASDQKTASDWAKYHSTMTTLSVMSGAAANRAQLCAQFLEYFYPEGMPETPGIRSKLQRWVETTNGCAAAYAAGDAMLCMYAAKERKLHHLRPQGQRRYHAAIRLVQEALTRANPENDDTLIGAITVLDICEMSFELGDNGIEMVHASNVRGPSHALGMQILITKRGPRILNSALGCDLTLNFLHIALMDCLLKRKACVFGQPEWQAGFDSARAPPHSVLHLAALGCLIPGLLEDADRMQRGKGSPPYEDYVNLLSKMTLLESRLLGWLSHRYRMLSNSQPFRVQLTAAPNVLPAKDCPFPVALQHRSFVEVLAHCNFWALMLVLRQAMLLVGSFANEDLLAPYQNQSPRPQRQKWKSGCYECADSICESVEYVLLLSEPQRGVAVQSLCSFLMTLVIPWYRQCGDDAKTVWCSRYIELAQAADNAGTSHGVDQAGIYRLTRAFLGWNIMAVES